MSEKSDKKVKAEKKRLASERQIFLDDMFNDVYRNRKRIYGINFIRGVFFGLGAFLGGTVVVALIVWILSRFDWPIIERLLDVLQR